MAICGNRKRQRRLYANWDSRIWRTFKRCNTARGSGRGESKSGQKIGRHVPSPRKDRIIFPFCILLTDALPAPITRRNSPISPLETGGCMRIESEGAWSVVISRTEAGEEAIQAPHWSVESIAGHEIDYKTGAEMHSHHLDNKRQGAYIRIEQRKTRGIPTPDYKVPISILRPPAMVEGADRRRNHANWGRRRWFRALAHAVPIYRFTNG